MTRQSFFLSVGIIDLAISYVLFTTQQYFSPLALVGIFIIVAMGILLLLLPYYHEIETNKKYISALVGLSIISIGLIISESYYDLAYAKFQPTSSIYIAALVAGALIFFAGMYLMKKIGKQKSLQSHFMLIAAIIVVSLLIYAVQLYVIHAAQWKGTDEIAFNYYASYLLLHGTNPYTANMASVLASNHLTPTYELNGTCECSYDYPALGFILLSPLSLSANNFLHLYVLAGIIVAVLVGLLLYKESKFNNYALVPIVVWFAAVFYFYPATTLTGLIAVSLFLVIAYIYRKNIFLCGVLIGIAISIHQLAWFVAPFFYVLILRESGKKAMLKAILISGLIFLLINGYFLAVTPHATIDNIFSLFLTKLQFRGPSLIQFLVTFFPAAYWSLTLLIIILFASSLLLFYFYNDTLRPLLAIVPIAMLFLSWRSTPEYTLVFTPLLIGVYYFNKDEKQKDILKNKKLIVYTLIIIILFAICIITYAHFEYVKSNSLQIVSLKYNSQINSTTGNLAISNIQIDLTNNGNKSEPIVFYLISRDPDYSVYTVDNNMPVLSPNSTYTYVFPVSTLQFNSATKIEVFVLDNDNIISARVK